MTTAAEITQNPEPPVIESASASTACQTNSSKTPYVITGVTLIVIMLIAAGLAALVVLGVGAAYSYSDTGAAYSNSLSLDDDDFGDYFDFDDLHGYGHDGYGYHDGYGWGGYTASSQNAAGAHHVHHSHADGC